jgi:hypothetical protein
VNEWVYATFYKGLWEVAGALHEQRYLDQLMEYCKKAGRDGLGKFRSIWGGRYLMAGTEILALGDKGKKR